MEEDIEYLKSLTKPPLREEWDFTYKLDKRTAQAIENLIKSYREKEESEKYLYDAYQDAGKKMFDYAEENEKLINKLKAYKYGMTMISEICVDESKCHITSKNAIEEVRKYIIY